MLNKISHFSRQYSNIVLHDLWCLAYLFDITINQASYTAVCDFGCDLYDFSVKEIKYLTLYGKLYLNNCRLRLGQKKMSSTHNPEQDWHAWILATLHMGSVHHDNNSTSWIVQANGLLWKHTHSIYINFYLSQINKPLMCSYCVLGTLQEVIIKLQRLLPTRKKNMNVLLNSLRTP